MSKDPNSEITVNDRRMFNPDGTLRQPIAEEPAPVSAPPAPEPAPEPRTTKSRRPRPNNNEASADFSNLVGLLMTNAAIHLGLDPQFKGKVDLDTARHFIEMLATLQEKTEGNLNEEEQQLLEDVVTRLRMEYVTIINQMTMSAKKPV
ncbi:MAG: DUF1844 domain-containing protein [Acidobacteriota bacterium]